MDFERSLDRQSIVAEIDDSPSETVVWAVATAADVDPTELRSFHDVVDTDALDALFRGRPTGRLTFEYHGYQVTIRDNREVVVQEPLLPEQ